MEEQENYNASFTGSDGSVNHRQQHFLNPEAEDNREDRNSGMVVDYMLNSTRSPQPQRIASGFGDVDGMSFADVMQLSDFGPKLSPNQSKMNGGDGGIDPVYFLKFPVLSDRSQDALSVVPIAGDKNEIFNGFGVETKDTATTMIEGDLNENEQMEEGGDARASATTMVQLRLIGGVQKSGPIEGKNRRKRPRSMKTSEEVESQRMTHIAVERNRRKQMNEHLRVLRSLMPGSYVQRGDQASIIGGAIEFVRELEQLLQCLESQKRRRMFGGDLSQSIPIAQSDTPIFQSLTLPNDHINILDFDGGGIREETAENKSCLADVEVKLLGFDAMIKVLSRRRPGQLLKTIAGLEDLQFNILHTNITTIEQTVLYSFNVKITAESRFTAEDIANSVQQIFGFIHASTI